jgi:PAS domain S-box-containing protein
MVDQTGEPSTAGSGMRDAGVGSPAVASLAGGDDLARLLLSSTGEGIYGIDLEGNCTFANPACLRLLGLEEDADLLGRNVHELSHHTRVNGDPYPVEECRIYQAYRQNEGTHVDDEVMFTADGRSFPVEYWSYPVERGGELVGCVVTFVDITERRRNERLLADQAASIGEVARFPEMNPGPVLRVDHAGTVLMANAAADAVFGVDLVGSCWRDICPNIDEAWQDILEATEVVALERRVEDREYVFAHRRDVESQLVFVYGADVTEQKQAERALRKSDELVRLLLNSTGEGIYGIDLEGNCTFANPACLKLLGLEEDADLLGRNVHELSHHTRVNGDPYPVEECRIYQAYRQYKGTHVDDEVMFTADGRSFPVEYWSYPVARGGELVGCVVTFVDITERRRVEEELRQTEKMAALGKLSAGLAHELNNPAAAAGRASSQLAGSVDDLHAATLELTAAGVESDGWVAMTDRYREFSQRSDEPLGLSALEISDREEELGDWLQAHGLDDGWAVAASLAGVGVRTGDLDTLGEDMPAQALIAAVVWICRALELHELAGTVARSSSSISALVDAVKSYSHMDQGPLQYVDIHHGIEDTLTILGYKLRGRIEVVREYDPNLPQIEVGGSELNQVWTNLIDNAIGALGEQGTITIRTARVDEYVTVEIADDGPGIPEELQGRVFDPFFTTKEVGQGTGLGLDVVRRIVTERARGQLELRSRPGETVFQVRLPVE